ncbi:MAG: magnesium chelatase [Anaerolineales bacterium]|nr:magnesium chelatase [Anaerolineales bacterium]
MKDSIASLTDLLEKVSSQRFLEAEAVEDLGLADQPAFPFLALVGQREMKLALLLTLINPNVGGVLLIGPRGTGKTTAVRSLVDLLPEVSRSRCHYGCLPEDIETGGMDAVCPDCAKRFGENESLIYYDRVRLIELPLNAQLEDVVGGLDERAVLHSRMRLKRGLLARADQNLLYVDEVNLLADDIVDAILDAAAQGTYTVHRGPLAATYRSRFALIGSMNPEEGQLRPQILDRFGLRVIVRGLEDREDRLEAYRRSIEFKNHPQRLANEYFNSTTLAKNELETARNTIDKVKLTPEAENFGLNLIQGLGVESLRAEITLFEAARAYAIADGREEASAEDISLIAPMAIRLRRSSFIKDYLTSQSQEEEELDKLMLDMSSESSKKTTKSKKSTKSKEDQ